MFFTFTATALSFHITLSIPETLILNNKSANFTHVFACTSSHTEDNFSPGESCTRWRECSGCSAALWPTFVALWRRQRTDWLVRGSFSSNVWFKCYIVMKLNMIDGVRWSGCSADSYCGECGRVTASRRRRRGEEEEKRRLGPQRATGTQHLESRINL